jgi:transcription elongation factor GreA
MDIIIVLTACVYLMRKPIMIKDRKGQLMEGPNLMTAETLKRMEKDLEKAIADEDKAHKAIGAAAGAEGEWHDNAAYDHAIMQHNVAMSRLQDMKVKLQNYEIIKPRQETDEVGIGNTVVVRFADEDSDEKFTILGPDDSLTRQDWISFMTPVAISILGKKRGEIGEFKIGEDREQQVKVVKILPGEFD